jgi:hypothetical protein
MNEVASSAFELAILEEMGWTLKVGEDFKVE